MSAKAHSNEVRDVTELSEGDRVAVARGEGDVGEFTVDHVRTSSWNGTTSAFVRDEDNEQYRLYNTEPQEFNEGGIHFWTLGPVSVRRT